MKRVEQKSMNWFKRGYEQTFLQQPANKVCTLTHVKPFLRQPVEPRLRLGRHAFNSEMKQWGDQRKTFNFTKYCGSNNTDQMDRETGMSFNDFRQMGARKLRDEFESQMRVQSQNSKRSVHYASITRGHSQAGAPSRNILSSQSLRSLARKTPVPLYMTWKRREGGSRLQPSSPHRLLDDDTF